MKENPLHPRTRAEKWVDRIATSLVIMLVLFAIGQLIHFFWHISNHQN